MQAIIQFFKEMSAMRLASTVVAVLTLLILFAIFIAKVGDNDMATLYSDLDLQDSAKVVDELEKRKIKYVAVGDGSIIRVSKSQVVNARLSLAQVGLPASGSLIGYEIFDKEDNIGSTNFSQNVRLIRALEGELSRTISAFEQVDKARVHLVMPQREIFSKEKLDPRASVVLKFNGNKRLGKSEIDAISHLVVTAVPGLEMKNVTIVDTKGGALKIGSSEESGGMGGGKNDEIKIASENRLRSVIEELLSKILGSDKVKAQVSLEMNFDRIVTNSETYDPEGAVIRSVQSIEEKDQAPVAGGSDQDASVANNIPGGGAGGTAASRFATTEKSDQTTNYEISKTIKNHISESGLITKMSIGILVDGTYTTDETTKVETYTPRSKEELDKITNLVKVAVGFSEDRSDKIEVVNMKFTSEFSKIEDDSNWIKEELPNLFQTLVFAIVVLLILITVIRPIALKAFDVRRGGVDGEIASLESTMNSGSASSSGAGGTPATSGVSGGADAAGAPMAAATKSNPTRKVNDIAENSPQELVNILRKWINEEQ